MNTDNTVTDQLVDYEEFEDTGVIEAPIQQEDNNDARKGHYVGMNSSTFKDFYLKDKILDAITQCGFEHPSEVQHACIPRAITNKDVLCQAKSGMGKTAVFVISTLQMIDEESDNGVQVLVLAHTRELAYQIEKEYIRFTQFMPNVKTVVVYGGININKDIENIQTTKPSIVVGTPGRILDLVRRGHLNVSKLRHFVVDECDHFMKSQKMRQDLQHIYVSCPHDKQVMMFTATLSKEIKEICRKYLKDPLEIELDDSNLTLHGLHQYYHTIVESDKLNKLVDLLDTIEFNQIVIFVKSNRRAEELSKYLKSMDFPNTYLTSDMRTENRIENFKYFKEYKCRILISTKLAGRGIDIEKVNVVINYDFPEQADEYLHRVGRAGRFGTNGLAISFISNNEEAKIMEQVQLKFKVEIPTLPDFVDKSLYMN